MIFKNIKLFERIGFIYIILLSITTWSISYLRGLPIAYNDAMSHLDLSRLVVDNIQPGFAQLGGTWLPLPHVLALVFIWNNWAWHSGFAGSIFCMIAYVASVIALYKTTKLITKSYLAAFLTALVFATNLNILYLQTTPLLESLYLGCFTLSVYFFVRWFLFDKIISLSMSSLFVFLSIFVRYDGWFVSLIQGFLVLFCVVIVRKKSLQEGIGKLMIFIVPVFFAMLLWFLWNILIFGDPFYFFLGHYSARAQQFQIETHVGLITHHNLKESILAYFYAILDNIGIVVTATSTIGALIFLLVNKYSFRFLGKLAILIFISSPIIFNILALYFGFSVLNIPQLNWNPGSNDSGRWFNVRYGILALPFFAVCFGFLPNIISAKFSRLKIPFIVLLCSLILYQNYLISNSGIVTIIDGVIGSSQFANEDIAISVQKLVKPNEKILLSTANFNAVAFKSGFDLKQFVHEGVDNEWKYALSEPDKYVKWIVMSNGDIGENVYTALVKNKRNDFLNYFKLAYTGKHANIYELRSNSELFTRRQQNKLYLGRSIFNIQGINSYDLAYMSDNDINTTFKVLSGTKINTMRFWLFGDGFADGFQPKAGIINGNRFKSTDLIIQDARKYHIKLIPVLLNNWNDYGGKEQYLQWVGKSIKSDFYTNQNTTNLFENYINHVLSRKNSLTNTTYAQESSILGWDIMNEPQALNPSETKDIPIWTDTIATYIKHHDQNHLVSIGTQDTSPVCNVVNIDMCSLHLYLYSNKTLIFNNKQLINDFLGTEIASVSSLQKPALVEELGIPKNEKPYGDNPLSELKQITNETNNLGYNGFLIWNWSIKPDDSFGFSPTGYKDGTYNLNALKTIY